ncbi:hypothetical protein BSL78_04459, partial [Apostichopus japonicus]
LQQLSSRNICDWEIFAVEDLKIEKEDVNTLSQYLTVTPSGVLVQACVKAAMNKWITRNNAHNIQQLLTQTISQSKVCNDFLCNDCNSYFHHKPGCTFSENECNGRRNKEQDKIVLSDKRQPASFATILRWIANLVGKVGSEYLMKSYGDTLGNIKVTNSSTPCHELFEQLVEIKLLSNETSSLQSLCEHLRNCYLFSAERITLLYIERIMPSQNLLRTIEITAPFDWDLFAKEKLKLTEDVIESAIKCYSGVEDQFEAVLCQFLYTSETKKCVAHLENILSKSIQEYNGCNSYKSSVSSQHASLKHGEHNEEPGSAVKHELARTTGNTARDMDPGIQQDQTPEHTEQVGTSEWDKRFESICKKLINEEMEVNYKNSSFITDKNKQELVIEALKSLEHVSTEVKEDIETYIGSQPRVEEKLHQTKLRCPHCGVSLYRLMLDQLGDILGNVGSARIANMYNFSNGEIKKIKLSYHPGHLLVTMLKSKLPELQRKESLQNLELYLHQSGLFRASYIVGDFMRKAPVQAEMIPLWVPSYTVVASSWVSVSASSSAIVGSSVPAPSSALVHARICLLSAAFVSCVGSSVGSGAGLVTEFNYNSK